MDNKFLHQKYEVHLNIRAASSQILLTATESVAFTTDCVSCVDHVALAKLTLAALTRPPVMAPWLFSEVPDLGTTRRPSAGLPPLIAVALVGTTTLGATIPLGVPGSLFTCGAPLMGFILLGATRSTAVAERIIPGVLPVTCTPSRAREVSELAFCTTRCVAGEPGTGGLLFRDPGPATANLDCGSSSRGGLNGSMLSLFLKQAPGLGWAPGTGSGLIALGVCSSPEAGLDCCGLPVPGGEGALWRHTPPPEAESKAVLAPAARGACAVPPAPGCTTWAVEPATRLVTG